MKREWEEKGGGSEKRGHYANKPIVTEGLVELRGE